MRTHIAVAQCLLGIGLVVCALCGAAFADAGGPCESTVNAYQTQDPKTQMWLTTQIARTCDRLGCASECEDNASETCSGCACPGGSVVCNTQFCITGFFPVINCESPVCTGTQNCDLTWDVVSLPDDPETGWKRQVVTYLCDCR